MNKDGYTTMTINTEAVKELREFVKDQLKQLGEHTTYSVDSINTFLEESLKAIG